jgi:hypothetical protein
MAVAYSWFYNIHEEYILDSLGAINRTSLNVMIPIWLIPRLMLSHTIRSNSRMPTQTPAPGSVDDGPNSKCKE